MLFVIMEEHDDHDAPPSFTAPQRKDSTHSHIHRKDSHHSQHSQLQRKDSQHSQISADYKSDSDSGAGHRMPTILETPPNGHINRYQASSLYYGLRRGPVVMGLIEMLLGIILLFPSLLVGNLPTCYATIGLTIITGIVGISLGCICIQPPNPMEISEHDVQSLLPMLEVYLALSVLSSCLAIASVAHGGIVIGIYPVPDNLLGVVSICMGGFLFILNIIPAIMVIQQLHRLKQPNVVQNLTEQRRRPLLIGGYHPSASSFNLSTMTHLQAAMRRSSSSSNTLHLLPQVDNQVNLLKRLDHGPPVVTGRDVFMAPGGRQISVTVNEYK